MLYTLRRTHCWRLSLVLQKLAVSAKLASQTVPRVLLSQLPALRLQAYVTCLSCYIWAGDLNLGPHACAASTLVTEISQHAAFLFLDRNSKERGIWIENSLSPVPWVCFPILRSPVSLSPQLLGTSSRCAGQAVMIESPGKSPGCYVTMSGSSS